MGDLVFIIFDSGEHRKTASVHLVGQAEINQALKIILVVFNTWIHTICNQYLER